MIRLVGYFLGITSGLTSIVSLISLIYQKFVRSDDDYTGGISEDNLILLGLLFLICSLIFYYTYKTGFGKSKLERTREELEIMKIKKEMRSIE